MPEHALHSACPIAQALDILGDRWSLLVLRDLLVRSPRRFGDFLNSPEGISTNILAERLKRLEANAMVEKRLYQNNPPRYEYHPTNKAHDLGPTLMELVKWGNKYIEGTFVPPRDILLKAGKKK